MHDPMVFVLAPVPPTESPNTFQRLTLWDNFGGVSLTKNCIGRQGETDFQHWLRRYLKASRLVLRSWSGWATLPTSHSMHKSWPVGP